MNATLSVIWVLQIIKFRSISDRNRCTVRLSSQDVYVKVLKQQLLGGVRRGVNDMAEEVIKIIFLLNLIVGILFWQQTDE